MISNEIIWVTGASSGIGYEVAKQLASQGNKVIASGRNADALNQLSQESDNILPFVCDLVNDSQQGIHYSLLDLTPHLDRIVLSAGDCKYLSVNDDDWSCIQQVMDINFHGTVRAIQAALPQLETSANGHIVAITSMASMAPFTQAEAYGASKAALSYFLKSLRIDLKAKNIDVTDVMPGFIDTPLTQKNDFDMPFLLTTSQASDAIIKAMEKRSYTAVFPKRLFFLFKCLSFFPRIWLSLNSDKNEQIKKSSVTHDRV